MDFLDAALVMLQRGWLTIPLGLDGGGFPKRPLPTNWPNLERTEDVIRSLPWGDAKGLGIVLGEASNNLAVIDLDDVALANAVYTAMGINDYNHDMPTPRMVRTIRKRGHLYVHERTPSRSRRYQVTFLTKEPISVELKTNGNQVAAPPTPGYSLLSREAPLECETIEDAWAEVQMALGIVFPGYLQVTTNEDGKAKAGYPDPWREEVPEHERNQSLFMEAHRLREAGVPVEQALNLLYSRIKSSYVHQGFSWPEAEATIHSAYRKGEVQQLYGRDESDLIP